MIDVECEQCHCELSHDDPTWVAHIIDGQMTPLCADCAESLGFTKEGIRD